MEGVPSRVPFRPLALCISCHFIVLHFRPAIRSALIKEPLKAAGDKHAKAQRGESDPVISGIAASCPPNHATGPPRSIPGSGLGCPASGGALGVRAKGGPVTLVPHAAEQRVSRANRQAAGENLGLMNDGTVVNTFLVLMKLDPDQAP